MTNEQTTTHSCGASSSQTYPFHLIPLGAIRRLATRFGLGAVKHGAFNWKKGLGDRDYAIERANHVIEHTLKLLAKLQGEIPDDEDDDAGAIMWGGAFLGEAIDAMKAKRPK